MSGLMISVSPHAVQRYRERILTRENEGGHSASNAEIIATLSGRIVRLAAIFGARVIRIPGGRIILDHTPLGVAVLTVLSIYEQLPRQLLPADRGGPAPIAQERAYFPRPVTASPKAGERP